MAAMPLIPASYNVNGRTFGYSTSYTGGDLEQIQMLLGDASIQTSKKYLAMRQNLAEAVNDKLEIVDAEGE